MVSGAGVVCQCYHCLLCCGFVGFVEDYVSLELALVCSFLVERAGLLISLVVVCMCWCVGFSGLWGWECVSGLSVVFSGVGWCGSGFERSLRLSLRWVLRGCFRCFVFLWVV